MTVIKVFQSGVKKPIDNEPLVESAVPISKDVEAGMVANRPQPDPRMRLMTARAKRASNITTLLLIAISSLLLTMGICGTFYIYKHCIRTSTQKYKTYCNVPYFDDDDVDQSNSNAALYQDRLTQDNDMFYRGILNQAKEQMFAQDGSGQYKQFGEKIEIDLDSGNHEKIYVPGFKYGRESKFVHDFQSNLTGIVDISNTRCFVMPLNRTKVLPPRDLHDLLQKMFNSYYTLEPAEPYRAIEEVDDIGDRSKYIADECRDFQVYRLEKVVGGVFKRSVDNVVENKAFTVLDGPKPRAIEIVNIENLATNQ